MSARAKKASSTKAGGGSEGNSQVPFTTVPVCGLAIAALDYELAAGRIMEWAAEGDAPYAVEAANTHVVSLARRDEEFGAAMQKFDLVCPDGMPLVWAANHALPREARLEDRVYGPTLMLRTIAASEGDKKLRHFFLGGQESTLEKLEARFTEECPDAIIAGTYSPPFGEWPEDEFERIRGKLLDAKANIIWVGLGCPKQELWIARNKEKLPPGVYLGIGAAFAFHAGEVSQAPAILQRIGMEWFYRLAMEPRRLWKRYFVHNSLFVKYWLTDAMRGD